jgi:hypothetical protein
MTANMKITVSWDSFMKFSKKVPQKRCYLSTRLHYVTSQKSLISQYNGVLDIHENTQYLRVL